MIPFLVSTWKIPLSALLFALAYPPWGFSFLVWVALVPGISVGMQSKSIRQALLRAAWACFWVNLLLFPWIFPALRDYVKLSPAAAAVAWQVFGLFCEPQLYVLGIGLFLLRKVTQPLALAFSIAFLYTGVDWIAPKIFMDTLGHATHNMPFIRQVSDLGGAYGITFLIVFHNVALYCFVKSYLDKRKLEGAAVHTYGVALLFLLVAFTYGMVRHDQMEKAITSPERTLSIVGIQANTTGFDKNEAYASMVRKDQMEKAAAGPETTSTAGTQSNSTGSEKSELDIYYDETFEKLIDTHMEMSELGASLSPRPDVVIWPETTYPALFGAPISQVHWESERRMIEFVEREQIPLIFGSYWQDKDKLEHNSVFHLSPTLSPATQEPLSDQASPTDPSLVRYDKTNLLLLGEYVFFEDWDLVKKIFPSTPNFGRGNGTMIFEIPMKSGGTAKLTPVLCYEILFADYLRNAMADSPDFILNLTNDSWFGEYGEPELHMAFAKFRALELRIPLVRITNTGVSATVLQDGRLVDRIGTSKKQIHSAVLPLFKAEPTPFEKGGHLFPLISLLLGLGLTATLSYRFRNA